MFQIISLLFVYMLSGFWLNYNIIKEKIIKMPSYLSGIIFIILCLPLINLNNSWYLALSLLFLTCIYVEITGLNSSNQLKERIFKTGFLLGFLILIDTSFFIFLPLVIGVLIYYNRFFWNHFIIQLIGLIYPLGLYTILYKYSIITLELKKPKIDLMLLYYDIKLIIVLFLILTLSLNELYHNSYKKTEKSKKSFNVIYTISILIIAQSILLNSLKFIHLLVLPVVIIIANYLIYLKYKKFKTFLLGLLLIVFFLKFLCP